MVSDTLPVIDPGEFGDRKPRADAVVHGIVLAAGRSGRFGDRNKLLADFEDEPIVRNATRPLLESTLDAVTVVVGHDADSVRDALADLAVTFVRTDGEGQGQSVAAGIETVRDANADAALIALGDMPAVSTASINHLITAYRSGVGSALAAGYDGQRGNPVVFDRQHFEALAALDGDRGGRDILRSADAAVVETGDPGVLWDIDRPADL